MGLKEPLNEDFLHVAPAVGRGCPRLTLIEWRARIRDPEFFRWYYTRPAEGTTWGLSWDSMLVANGKSAPAAKIMNRQCFSLTYFSFSGFEREIRNGTLCVLPCQKVPTVSCWILRVISALCVLVRSSGGEGELTQLLWPSASAASTTRHSMTSSSVRRPGFLSRSLKSQ